MGAVLLLEAAAPAAVVAVPAAHLPLHVGHIDERLGAAAVGWLCCTRAPVAGQHRLTNARARGQFLKSNTPTQHPVTHECTGLLQIIYLGESIVAIATAPLASESPALQVGPTCTGCLWPQ
jgi:low temperature requirement protein LtrA